MRTLADDDEIGSTAGPSKGTSQQPAWMRNLHERSREWLAQLPSVSFLTYHDLHIAHFPALDIKYSAEAIQRQSRSSLPFVLPGGHDRSQTSRPGSEGPGRRGEGVRRGTQADESPTNLDELTNKRFVASLILFIAY